MRTILRIEGTLPKEDKQGNTYFKTLAILDDGDEVWGFSTDKDTYKPGMEVERFYDHTHNEAKMRLSQLKGELSE